MAPGVQVGHSLVVTCGNPRRQNILRMPQPLWFYEEARSTRCVLPVAAVLCCAVRPDTLDCHQALLIRSNLEV